MRNLSNSLTTAQKNLTGSPLVKCVLTKSGQTTRGYDISSIVTIQHPEQQWSQTATVTIDNSTGALSSLDLRGYKGVISWGIDIAATVTAWAANTAYIVGNIRRPTTSNGYQYRCTVAGTSHATTEPTWPTSLGVTVTDGTVTWEMDGNEGDEYSICAPLWVVGQQLLSWRGGLTCTLALAGTFNLMDEDKANTAYTPDSTNTDTIMTIIQAICGATMTCFNHTTAYTVTFDSTDAIINTYTPKNSFSVMVGESRLQKIKELLGLTTCVARVEDDGEIHIFEPTTSGIVYDYNYTSPLAGYHPIFTHSHRKRFLTPNYVVVSSRPEDASQYSGTAEDTDSSALFAKRYYQQMYLSSNAEAALIASAILAQAQYNAEEGSVEVPMNCGAEVHDYIDIFDKRLNLHRISNTGFQERTWDSGILSNRDPKFNLEIRLGSIDPGDLSLLGTSYPAETEWNEGWQDRIKKLTWIVNKLLDVIPKISVKLSALESKVESLKDTMKRIVVLKVIADDTALTTGDGKMYFTMPKELNGMNLIAVAAAIYTVSSSGTPTIQIHNATDAVDMLSTAITIDVNEKSSETAATPPVIDTTKDDVVTRDQLRIDVDVAGTGTKGLDVILIFRLP